MSRIQNIMEKAERDGAVRRMRPLIEPAGATLAHDVPLAVPPAMVEEAPAAPAVTPPPVIRTARAQLDRILVAALAPDAFAAEQYRSLRTRVAHTDRGQAADVILITSPGRGEGKSLTAANLALTMGQDFQTRICVIDADLRHSRLHRLFGLLDTPGLADVLAGQATLADALVTLEDYPLTVLPAGQTPAHPAELLGSSAMRRTVQTLRSQFDRVIIDAPSTSPLADVGILAPLVDSVLLVVQAGTTTKPAIQEAVSAIGPSKLLGVVLNNSAAA
jgi:capsular exopolysaccharide synthesis family protein